MACVDRSQFAINYVIYDVFKVYSKKVWKEISEDDRCLVWEYVASTVNFTLLIKSDNKISENLSM